MAFHKMSMSSTIIVLVMFLLNHQPSTFVRADDELIRQVCHNSEAPTTCNQCVKADNRSDKANTVGIATIVVDCIKIQANNLQTNISTLGSIYKDDFAANRTITKCGELFSHAKSDLNAVSQDLKNGDYDASDRSIFNALLYQNSCKNQCKNNPKIIITSHIFYGFKMYEELSQIALSILNRL
ncbi:hypothetical protein MKW98_003519 [Papaver atlanticum]|uniref:Pectinesterase inhibitor domain-containing protein n=1 Tax=Papaver atlanticum TaxID=357466 RepID=A0AAD4TCV3_9MAGN|nr:hypothetical protein MKW98_003519 [Papaver atlanticum]